LNKTKCLIFALITGFMVSGNVYAQELTSIQLPPPQMNKGKPVMEALKNRESRREFSAEDLPLQTLSDLLWAASGVNRPESGKRTAPSTMDMREIDIYVAKAEGLYLYDAGKHALSLTLKQDIRALTGKQTFVQEAPVNFIFVADFGKMEQAAAEQRMFYAATDTGFISENVYLYCASEGLATVVRGWFDETPLAKAMKLRDNQKIILTQTVGYPKNR